MKISSKGRYGVAALICIAERYGSGSLVTTSAIADKLGISKIYLEQVFALLKRAGLVNSVKGSQGGYRLSRAPGEISVYDVLAVIENSLMEKTPPSSSGKVPELERVLDAHIYQPLDREIRNLLTSVTLEDLLDGVEQELSGPMYYI